MKTVQKLADEMRIYVASEKLESEEVYETLLANREDEEAALLSVKNKVGDIFVGYIMPAEKAAKSGKLDADGFYSVLMKLTEKFPQEWRSLRDGYEADGITKHSARLNAMIDKYEELATVFAKMTEEAKE